MLKSLLQPNSSLVSRKPQASILPIVSTDMDLPQTYSLISTSFSFPFVFTASPLPPFTPSPYPNTFSSPFDASYPGTLPKLDPFSIIQAVRAALAFNCEVPAKDSQDQKRGEGGSGTEQGISWDRKHYFYSDLTAGWQITQKYGKSLESNSDF